MLDNYKEEQPLFYEQVMHSIKNHKLSHAFLIETNQYEKKDDLILSFIKTLFCTSHYTNYDSCNECNICHLIDNHSLSDFLVISPDGSWIKKDQILEIKEKFKTTSFQNRPRIYLIKQADKLNKQAANSLLKFLEEPDGNVIAILEVDNRYKVLETIRSRCQIYTFINRNYQKTSENFDKTCEIIKTLEQRKLHSISYLPIVLENDYRNREFWNNIFYDMIQVYDNAIRKYKNLTYYNFGEILDIIINFNSFENIISKIEVLFTCIKRLDYNLNMPMMLDQFIIEFNRG